MKNVKILFHYIPGLFLCVFLAITAKLINEVYPVLDEIILSIALGFLFSWINDKYSIFKTGISFAEKKLLSLAVGLMGFGINFGIISSIGTYSFFIIALSSSLILLLAIYIGKIIKIKSNLSMLLGVGQAICGSSAIAVISSIINKKRDPEANENMGIAISSINILGSLALLALPFLVLLNFDDLHWSLLIGGSLQAVGHVIAFGYAINENVGDTSITIKMARVSLLIPLIFIFTLKNRLDEGEKIKLSPKLLPIYLYAFLFTAALSNTFSLPKDFLMLTKDITHFLILLVMVALGAKLQVKSFINKGIESISFGALLFFVHILLVYMLIFSF